MKNKDAQGSMDQVKIEWRVGKQPREWKWVNKKKVKSKKAQEVAEMDDRKERKNNISITWVLKKKNETME